MPGVQGIAQIDAASWSDTVDLKLKVFDGFGSFHVLANILEAFVIGFEVGENDNFKMLVAALL